MRSTEISSSLLYSAFAKSLFTWATVRRFGSGLYRQTVVDITSNTFYKCTATFRTQICRKCLRIKLNGFRPVQTLVDVTSNAAPLPFSDSAMSFVKVLRSTDSSKACSLHIAIYRFLFKVPASNFYLSLFSSCLHLPHRLPVIYTFSSISPSLTCFIRQFLRHM
jgi:hypothetical protein